MTRGRRWFSCGAQRLLLPERLQIRSLLHFVMNSGLCNGFDGWRVDLSPSLDLSRGAALSHPKNANWRCAVKTKLSFVNDRFKLLYKNVWCMGCQA